MSDEAGARAALAAQAAGGQTLPYPDTDQGPLLIRTVWALISLSTIVVVARFWSKLRKTRRLYWDDALIAWALICGLIHAAWITWAVHWGLGRHMAYLNEEQISNTLRIGIWSLMSAFLSPMAGRMAFCVTILFVTGTDPRMKKWPIWMFFILQLVVNISALLTFYTQYALPCPSLRNDVLTYHSDAAVRSASCGIQSAWQSTTPPARTVCTITAAVCCLPDVNQPESRRITDTFKAPSTP